LHFKNILIYFLGVMLQFWLSLNIFYFHDEQPMRLDTISEVISFLQKYEQKMIAHNGDNYIMSITILRDFYMKENICML
jgi:hypothetical protein